jgi:hypothetical protein
MNGVIVNKTVGLAAFVIAHALSAGTGVRREPVNDPALDNLPAAFYNIPAAWHFRASFMQGSPCLQSPSAVFRATSPDGLSFVEDLPTYAWMWVSGWTGYKNKQDGCLAFRSDLKPQDFLKYISATLNVEYLADEPIPADVNAKFQKSLADLRASNAQFYASTHLPPPENTIELARASVRFRNGSFVMKGRLETGVNCTAVFHKGMKSMLRGMADQPDWTVHNCFAQVRFSAAPEDKYQSVIGMLDAVNIGPETNKGWAEARRKHLFDQSARAMQQFSEADKARQQAQAQQFAHDQAVRQQMHENFLASMQRGTDLSMQRAAQVANSNHRMAQDVVDYALDRQTVLDPGTGQISKVSSAYSYTWVDSTGKTSFQTNDASANPNGSLQGNWTRQQVVHGDGSK